LCNYNKLNERIQELVLALSPALHAPASGQRLPFSAAYSLWTKEDVIALEAVAFIAHT